MPRVESDCSDGFADAAPNYIFHVAYIEKPFARSRGHLTFNCCQVRGGVAAIDEPDAKLIVELAKLHAQRGQRNVQRTGGASEMTVISNRDYCD
ncbi:hypothetical protein Sbs19_27740 [Sphingobium sp. BS19]|nr:hypothetical protein [Sphingobium sp. BS19]GLI98956.1 hypothetical protein Sbs19_27740 [Sphingobium sp. BS19]